jgi:hypothetical protein
MSATHDLPARRLPEANGLKAALDGANKRVRSREDLARAIQRRPRSGTANHDMAGNAVTKTGERHFDLNIEKVLEGWSVSHAIRELIANALDEQTLSGTREIEIAKVADRRWRIRDFGRGLKHTHLTQNENAEKHLREPEVIGRFGVGLKDALAVLDRRGVDVTLCSAHGEIALVHRAKSEFTDVTTLHARIRDAKDDKMSGTEVVLSNLDDGAIQDAKAFFVCFSDEQVIESTKVGQILRRSEERPARIYVKGLLVAEEPNFAFSYNVTSLTQAMRKALNRERTNVGRTAYGERVKAMLLSAESEAVLEVLATDLAALADGTGHDEIGAWNDVGIRACCILNAKRNVIFLTAEQLVCNKEMVDRAIREGREIIAVPATIVTKLEGLKDVTGKPVQSLFQFHTEWSASIEYKFINEPDLTAAEREIYERWQQIAGLSGGLPRNVKALKVSETMRPSVSEGMDPVGIWEPATGHIVVHRSQLRRLDAFAGTLLHEITHARTGHSDVSRDCESALTALIGLLAARACTTLR